MVEKEDVSLARLLRHLGENRNLIIVQALLEKPGNPTGLGKRLNMSTSSIRTQLQILRELGIVSYTENGRKHVYQISNDLPSLTHKILIELIRLETISKERLQSSKSKALSRKTREKIKELEEQRTRARLDYFYSFLGNPVLISKQRYRKNLKKKIKSLDNQISHLKLNDPYKASD